MWLRVIASLRPLCTDLDFLSNDNSLHEHEKENNISSCFKRDLEESLDIVPSDHAEVCFEGLL
jgi:hypothetical protein